MICFSLIFFSLETRFLIDCASFLPDNNIVNRWIKTYYLDWYNFFSDFHYLFVQHIVIEAQCGRQRNGLLLIFSCIGLPHADASAVKISSFSWLISEVWRYRKLHHYYDYEMKLFKPIFLYVSGSRLVYLDSCQSHGADAQGCRMNTHSST